MAGDEPHVTTHNRKKFEALYKKDGQKEWTVWPHREAGTIIEFVQGACSFTTYYEEMFDQCNRQQRPHDAQKT